MPTPVTTQPLPTPQKTVVEKLQKIEHIAPFSANLPTFLGEALSRLTQPPDALSVTNRATTSREMPPTCEAHAFLLRFPN